MPLKKGCSMEAFQDNIRRMIREGYPRNQAVAAAYETLRRACLSPREAERAKRERWTPKEIVGEELENLRVMCEALEYLVKEL